MKKESNYDNYWTNFKMSLLGIKESWVVTILENTLWIHKVFHLVALNLTSYIYGNK
jgi:hypothetical protein